MRIFLQGIVVAIVATMGARVMPAQAPAGIRDSSASRGQVSVVIFAEASAKEVSFNGQPQLHVRLSGGLDSVHVLDRRNLPSPVVKGTTCRDVYVAVELFGRMNAECISRTLTGGPAGDCASLELRGTSGASRPSAPPTNQTARDSIADSTSRRRRPPRN